MRNTKILIVLVAAVCSAWLTTLLDNGLGLDWAQTAVRNWEQYGLSELHGKLVTNPGGFQADTNPEIYRGHRPASMYPVFFCYHIFASIGLGGLGFIAYYALVAAMVLLSTWWLLGNTDRAFWLAAVAVVAPGFVRWQTSLDPNLAAVLFGFPFCAAVVTLLRRPSLNWPRVAILFALILVFSMLNWTTVFVHALLFVTLFVLTRTPRRHLIIYAGLTAALAGWVLLASITSKMNQAADSSTSGFASMWQGYGWGDVGYGQDLTTRTALIRLLAANILGLLPVLVCLGWQWWRQRSRASPAGLLSLLPLLVVCVEILGMRNYFGHHPWMSVHYVLLAIILAVVVWKDRAEAAPAGKQTPFPFRLAGLAASCVYCFIVLSFAQAQNGRELAFATFIRERTVRDTTILIRRDADPELAEIADRLAPLLDRHIVVATDAGEPKPIGLPAKWVILTAASPAPGTILAQVTLADAPPPLLGTLLGWYSGYIAHRRQGDKLEIPGQTLFLFQPAS